MSLRLFTALLVLVPCQGQSANGLCDPKDDPVQCGALCDLYFLQPSKAGLKGWADGTSLCGWSGVTCSGSEVTALDLSNRALDGDIPASIGNLSSLLRLDLSSQFGANNNEPYFGRRGIPDTIGNLSKLQRLDLSHNDFGGSLPASIGNMASLELLILNHNNPFGGSIPDSIGQLSNLQVFDMSHTQTTGSIPSSLLKISSLSVLDLSHCILTGALPDMSALVNLGALNLTGNKFTSWTSHSTCDLIYEHALTQCNIYGNPLKCPIPDCATKCGATCEDTKSTFLV